ncbi:MAG: hypothetical protein AAB558_04725 [Patescibacteria group bacterium]
MESQKQKKSGGHGMHWIFVSSGLADESSVERLVLETFKSGKLVKKFPFDGSMLKGEVSVREKRFDDLVVTGNALNGEIGTAYPSIDSNLSMKGTITDVEEWANEVEAQVKIKTENMSLTFFALDYAENRDKYVSGNEFDFSLTGLAIALKKGSIAGGKLPSGQEISPDFTGIFYASTVFKNSNFDIDDYQVHGKIENVRKTRLAGLDAFIFTTKIAGTEKWKLTIDIGVFAKNISGEIPGKNDKITTGIWLTGRIKETNKGGLFGWK